MNAARIPVRIKLDRWDCSISPFVIRIDPARGQEVEWICDDGEVEVTFPDGDFPFEGERRTFSGGRGGGLRSTKVRPGLAERSRFPYVAVVRSNIGVVARLEGILFVAPGTSSTPVEVKILRNDDGTLRAEPDEVTLFRKKDDRALWTCDFGAVDIVFDKDGSPFEETTFSGEQSQGARSGRWKSGMLLALKYHYSIRVQLPDGTELELDPGVVVDDGGGDGL
jgi:hypothetical protein